jgi:hypothetical protein
MTFFSCTIRIRINLKCWIRNPIDLKCWIRILIETNADPQHWFSVLSAQDTPVDMNRSRNSNAVKVIIVLNTNTNPLVCAFLRLRICKQN